MTGWRLRVRNGLASPDNDNVGGRLTHVTRSPIEIKAGPRAAAHANRGLRAICFQAAWPASGIWSPSRHRKDELCDGAGVHASDNAIRAG